MKKDKAVRKAELKAALIKQLKSMIGPLVILLVIVAGIFVIMTYQGDKEETEVIPVNAYEGQTEEMVLESDKIKFVMDPTTTQFKVHVKDTGAVWSSNPENAANDPVALMLDKQMLQSTLVLTYSTANGVDTIFNNYAYSIEKQIYEIEQGDDYIKVHYSVGDVDKEYMVPPVITESNMDAIMANMSQSNAMMIEQYYKKYDINKLGKKDDKELLLANYPILENEVIYVLRDTTKDGVKEKLEVYFEEAGYTYEDYQRDKELDLAEKTTDTPVFNVNVIYRLDGDDLIVEIPLEEIQYREDYPLYSLSVLPYFGAGEAQEEGYLLVPEGGGALINFNNGKVAQNAYYANVYGWDMALDRDAIVHETRTCYNTFGVAKEDSSFICILEEGASYASIQADISGKSTSYNAVNAVYSLCNREQYDVEEKSTTVMFVYQPELPNESLISRYRFVDSGSYVNMAASYGEYLQKQYDGYLTLNEDTEAPVAVEIVSAVDKVKQVCGVPMSRPLELTTYKEAEAMLKELKDGGMNNMSVKLTGWMNGGVNQSMLSKIKLISDLGSKKDFKNLLGTAKELGVELYLDGVTNYAYNSDLLDGFWVYTDAARFVSKEKAELYTYDTVDFNKQKGRDTYYLLTPSLISEMTDNLVAYAQKNDTGVSFRDIGKVLSSDFSTKHTVSRQKAMNLQIEKLKAAKDAGTPIMINMGNDYALAYADMAVNMDLCGSEYTILDETIPFYQLAVHGYLNYTGEPLNLAQDYEKELLKSAEYGAGLSFTLMDESSFSLQKTLYTEYFGAEYAAWHDKMLEVYNRYNAEMGHVFHQRMTGHELVADQIACTTYEDGTKVYVNYTYNDYTAKDGTAVPARDYAVVR